jgi:apolipoprotein N-acyltransferase
VSGLLLAFAFPPFSAFPVAWVALIPFLRALESLAAEARTGAPRTGVSAVRAGFLFGFAFFLPLLWWIALLDAPTLTIPWVRYPATLAVPLYLGVYPALFSLAYVRVRSRTRIPAFVVAPLLWTAAEVLRGTGEMGFPWGEAGYSQVPFLPALQAASVVGVGGLTAWIVLVNGILAGFPGRRPVFRLATTLLVIALPLAAGRERIEHGGDWKTVRCALVQPNIANETKWNADLRPIHFETLAQLTRKGIEAGAEFVVWPETAAPCYLLKDARWRPFVEDLARETGVPIFLGTPDYQVRDGGRVTYTNSGAFMDSRGFLGGRMDKILLVPFGERLPFTAVLPFLNRLDFGEADFLPGTFPIVFHPGDWGFGALVCFEAIFPGLSAKYVEEGAEMLVAITNDSWFGAGSGAEQHARMATVRCVETGCGMARAANSGISMGIDPFGRTFGETALFERTVSVVDVPLREGRTIYSLAPGLWSWVGIAGSVILLAMARFRRRGWAVPEAK